MTEPTRAELLQQQVDALTAQLGTRATPAAIAVAQRIAGLSMLCGMYEAELARTGKIKDARGYVSANKGLVANCIAIGVTLNPRTATVGARSAQGDDHAALFAADD